MKIIFRARVSKIILRIRYYLRIKNATMNEEVATSALRNKTVLLKNVFLCLEKMNKKILSLTKHFVAEHH